MTTEEFWLNVRREASGCWVWLRARNKQGYGLVRFNKVTIGAHRLAYQLTCGDIPAGLFVCHRCDNPPCCNPDHLFLGTTTDNQRDCVNKGRHKLQKRPQDSAFRGQYFTGRAKLTEGQVVEIRTALSANVGPYTLARQYGVCYDTIRNIAIRRTWRLI